MKRRETAAIGLVAVGCVSAVVAVIAVLRLGSVQLRNDERECIRWAVVRCDTASWYARPGDRWSRRFPVAHLTHGWPFRVGEFPFQCALNGVPLFSLVRVTAENGATLYALVTDRIGNENAPTVQRRIDLTWAGFATLAQPELGLLPVKVEVAE